MKRRIAWSIAVLVLIVANFLLWRHTPEQVGRLEEKSTTEPVTSKSASATSPPLAAISPPSDIGQPIGHELPERAQPPLKTKRALQSIFNARLSLYGKVLDQDGQPVRRARIRIGVADKPWESGSSHQRTTGADGLFEITDVKGTGIFVGVEKEGYYAGKDASRLLQSGEMPTKDAPAIWRLYRSGPLEPLTVQPYKLVEIPLDGTPVEYDFNTGKFVGADQGQLRAEVKVEGSMQQRFSWWYRISVQSGGLARRSHEFDFVAPEQGYVEVLEGRVNADDKDWRGGFGGDFFVRLPNGKFGRLAFSLGRGRDIFDFRIAHVIINPTGGRNLEVDPKKVMTFEAP